MPPLPWTKIRQPDPEATYLVMATHLPLTGYRFIPKFLRQTMQIRRQLATSDGLIGYSLDAKLLKRQFRTVSVWESREAAQAFARAEPHATVMRTDPERMGDTRFRTWEVAGRDLPVSWRDAAAHLEPAPVA
jgi:heme-degrading monooxygenase HmoA